MLYYFIIFNFKKLLNYYFIILIFLLINGLILRYKISIISFLWIIPKYNKYTIKLERLNNQLTTVF